MLFPVKHDEYFSSILFAGFVEKVLGIIAIQEFIYVIINIRYFFAILIYELISNVAGDISVVL